MSENPNTSENITPNHNPQSDTSPKDTSLQFESRLDLSAFHQSVNLIRSELSKVIVEQNSAIQLLITGLFSGGHILLEGVPGVAKTLMAKLLAKTIEADFSRIQFTPDLMPSDVLGTSVFNKKQGEFEFKKGPIFSNIILIDEINRAPAKTQAALFEVMEERQITIDGKRYEFQAPFMILATQNPVEQEGTYRLPEAQLDRFLFKIVLDYPSLEGENEILLRQHNQVGEKLSLITSFLSKEKIVWAQEIIKKVILEPRLIRYIAQIVHATRSHPYIYLGASPRASIGILTASKAFAATSGRDFVTPEDIKFIAQFVLSHRIIITPEREMEGITAVQIIKEIIESIEIPT
ncbi:MAG: magnesium chelatase [Flavobacteriaceae bacterium]|nr:MAG: magnesium chelatase [Flavobacteriaceae bacterium]